MAASKRKLLNSDDLKELYRVTNPKMDEKPRLFMVTCLRGNDWVVENSDPLRGYRGCQTNLEARVRQYESNNLWPDKCDLGIGIFESDKLVRVLAAVDRGHKPVDEVIPSLPLDDLLGVIGLTRSDIQE